MHPRMAGIHEKEKEFKQWISTELFNKQTDYKRRPRRPPFLLVLSEGVGVTSWKKNVKYRKDVCIIF